MQLELESETIVLDVDGVLLNYHVQYAWAWQQAFGTAVHVVDEDQYYPQHRYGLPHLEHARLEQLRSKMKSQFWSTMPLIEGAKTACELMVQKGYRLVCVSALEAEHKQDRWDNLMHWKLPIDELYATGGQQEQGKSPKSSVVNHLNPGAFVDDFAPYFKGVCPSVHLALIDRNPKTSPNHTPEAKALGIGSYHKDLLEFAQRLSPWRGNKA